MAERKAVNKYYPPDWTPKMGSINKYNNSHPLRERARKLGQGILIIRFEMPYNIWCGGCGNHIGMGVRYNAEKKKVGMYYTTPIYQFRMKCHLCDNHFEMKTDPQNLDYIVVNGARRQEGRWDPMQNEQVVPEDKETSQKLASDAMFKLEHGVDDQKKSNSVAPSLAKLEDLQTRWRDDYSSNKIIRQQFREKKKEILKRAETDKLLLVKSSLNITLLPEDPQDVKVASLLRLAPLESFDERQKMLRDEIQNKPIFDKGNSATGLLSTSEALKKLVRNSQNLKIQCTSKSLSASNIGITLKTTKPEAANQKSPSPEASQTPDSLNAGKSNMPCVESINNERVTGLVAYSGETTESDDST